MTLNQTETFIDGELDIAIGISARSRVWKNEKILWSDLVGRLCTENKTNETHKEYQRLNKQDQFEIKNVGGYVGGYLRSGRRHPENVMHRQLLTLDIDNGYDALWDDFTMLYGNAAVLHATHSHHPDKPRYRLIIPLSREVEPDEYIAIARRVAGDLGIDYFDNTTFEINRLMFWPSSPKDLEYHFCYQDGDWLSADDILASYVDWKDSSAWPISASKLDQIRTGAERQEDPTAKRGLIGAFCRTYTIHAAIEEYLKDEYEPVGDGFRYTYKKGSAAAGLVTYEDKFAYSHHGTDPSSGKLCNAFDLVRLHRFGHLDSTPEQNKSFKAMEDCALCDDNVKKQLASENLSSSKYDFAEPLENIEAPEENIDWMSSLELNTKGEYTSTASNLGIIFNCDRHLLDKFKYNQFDGKIYSFPGLPWRKSKYPEPIRNVDFSGVRNYLEIIYGINGQLKIDDTMILESERNAFNPVKYYLDSLEWDGKPRIDNLLIDYFGATDNIYTREAMRKPLTAAVARIFEPGRKFDLVLTLVGAQGTKKSSFIKKLAKHWFSDTFTTVTGKESFEQIQGVWIMEIAELAGLRKAEVESIKHFISKQEDTFRPAYGRTSETYKRQCIFIGTTNNKEFLTDPTGNRRFMPVDIYPERITKEVFTDLDSEIDQIWAEAVELYRKGESLFLSEEAEYIAGAEREIHSENDERSGIIEAYLNTLLPDDWDALNIFARRTFLNDPIAPAGKTKRKYVCIAEIWCECLSQDREGMSRYKTREVNNIMKALPDWELVSSTKNFYNYGKQKYYQRKREAH